MMKKLIALALVLALAFSMVACSSTKAVTTAVDTLTDTAETTSATNPGDAIAVKAGDETATCSEVEETYNYYVQMYSYYGMSAPTEDADIESMQDSIVDSFAERLVLLYQAKALGYTLTEEQKAELDQTIADNRAGIISSYAESISVSEDATDAEKEAAAVALANADITAYYGYDMTLDQYMEEMRKSYEENYLTENLEAGIKATATVTEDDIKATYDTYLATDKTTYEADATAYLSAEESYEKQGGRPVLYVPAGYSRVKALTILPKAELSADYETAKTEMTALEAEYGALVLGGNKEDVRVAEIETRYAELKAQADEMYAAYTKEASEKAAAAYAELQAGTAFDTVFAANNEDTDYTTYAAFNEKGRLMMTDADDGAWDDALRTAAKGLTAGQYSEPIEVDGTYYILYMVGEEPAGERSLESVHSEIETLSASEHAETVWAAQQEAWLADTSLVTRYPENYRYIGKNA